MLFLAYLPRLHTVRLRRQALRAPPLGLTGRILALGVPSLLTQILTALVQITLGNLLRVHERPACTAATSLSVYGMMMKVYQIAHSMFVGVSSAVQPINGYNWGEAFSSGAADLPHGRRHRPGNFGGVVPRVPAVSPADRMLFASDSPLYLDCAQHCFRLYMAAFFLYGLHLATASFFQGIGWPVPSLPFPWPGRACFLIPLAILLSGRFGLDGALLAAPFRRADLPPELAAGPAGVCRHGQRDWIET